MKPIRLAVRKVIEHLLRCGDIDSGYVDSQAMLDGAKAHRKLQAMMGANYQKEVPLSLELELSGIPVILHGRADGVIIDGDSILIDEIKTTTLPLDKIFMQKELHIGQAKCYAHMLLESLRDPEQVTIQLTYYQLETEEMQRHDWTFSKQEIADFFNQLMADYGVWLLLERDWGVLRNASIKSLEFPFASYRAGQRRLAVSVYSAIDMGKKLYAQAPTGIGKTLSALYPSIKAMGEGKTGTLFYLTAKTVTRAVAEDAVRLMAQKGLRIKLLTLRAKDKICFCEQTTCNPEHCEFAKGHFDRVNRALLDILQNCDIITPQVTEQYAKKHRVCPHEFALDAAEWMDVIVCDYNHVFDPAVYLRRFFNDTEGNYVFLIDEAHNLCDRVRDMYTQSLRRSAFTHLKSGLKDKNPAAKKLRSALGQAGKYLQAVREKMEHITSVSAAPDAALVEAVTQFVFAAKDWLALEQRGNHPLHAEMLELFFSAQSFLGIAESYDEHYTTITELFGSDVCVTLYCLDPSQIIKERLGFAKASALFSATLTPLPYYRDILGGEDGDGMIALSSPFEQDNLLLTAHYGISTKYADRGGSIAPLAETIYMATSQKRGNYIIYFPSYEYLRSVYDEFSKRYPEVRTILQLSAMEEQTRADFLDQFSANGGETLLGFCVLGGIFSEGIDLKGERLIGAVVVGVGLPKLSLRQDLIREYYNKKNGAGYDYAYVFPGMNKVLQAAGRVIRSESDRGIVLLIDSRFNSAQYRSLYPAHWNGIRMVNNSGALRGLLKNFWEK